MISKFMTSQTGQEVITVKILPNISRSKVNQTIKFRQLIKCNISVFLDTSYTKSGGEVTPRPLYKNLKLSISLDQQSEML